MFVLKQNDYLYIQDAPVLHPPPKIEKKGYGNNILNFINLFDYMYNVKKKHCFYAIFNKWKSCFHIVFKTA
jgi:hypothetical protein